MTVEVKSQDTQMPSEATKVVEEKSVDDVPFVVKEKSVDDVPVVEEKSVDDVPVVVADEKKPKEEEEEGGSPDSSPPAVGKSSSFKEESGITSDLKDLEKKALIDLKAKIEDAILNNKIYKQEEQKADQVEEKAPKQEDEKIEQVKEKSPKQADEKIEEVKENEEEQSPKQEDEKIEQVKEKEEVQSPKQEDEKIEQVKEKEEVQSPKQADEKIEQVKEKEEVQSPKQEDEKIEQVKEKSPQQEEEKSDNPAASQFPDDQDKEQKKNPIDVDISLWGVPLLPSKGEEGTDVILLKFLRARDFKVNEAFDMLINTLEWRKQNKMDSILDEDSELEADLSSAVYMDGVDREGHPICYNVYGVFEDKELYQKIFGTQEKCQKFLRWRFQLMEKGIKQLNFCPAGVSSLLQINDLKNAPGPSKKELRLATKQAVGLLQDNYPEFVARNIFVNVPFWYYAFNAILSPFLTQRTKSKFVFARPSKVTETLLKYIPVEQIPTRYGGLKRENDTDFSVEDGIASELTIKAGSTETIEIDAPEAGHTLVWDLHVLGWEVNYKEEFVPSDEGSYTIIVHKEKKIASEEAPIRNSFRNNEPGKVVLTIENGSYKKKRVFYRYKTKTTSS